MQTLWQTAKLTDSYRKGSEDRAAILLPAPDTAVLLVADGVGGQPNGGNAATLAIALAEQFIAQNTQQLLAPHFWTQLLATIDSELGEDPDCGETTLTAACLTPSQLVGANVGDSEAWWIDTNGAITTLTGGHGRKPYIGCGSAFPFGFAVPTPPAGTLLVATDGLFKYTYEELIAQILCAVSEDLTETAYLLHGLVGGSSGVLPDDFAAALATKAVF